MKNVPANRASGLWDPVNWASEMRGEIDRVFDRSMTPYRLGSAQRTFFAPDIDLKDEKDRLLVKADIPGVKKEDLSITVQEGHLTIQGERKESQEKTERGLHYSERFEGSFLRTIELPARVKADSVKASYKDGVLEISLPKDETARPKEVKVPIL